VFTKVWSENLNGKYQMEDVEIGCEGVEWIHLAQDRDRWRAVVTAAMNLLVSWKTRNVLSG
jgi:hypothetical protein